MRAALGEARFDAIDRIGEVAAANQVEHVIVAGDIFDTEGPEDRVIVQAVSRMQRYPCRWWLLPGNHDYARNGGLWDRVRHKASDNIILLTEPVAQLPLFPAVGLRGAVDGSPAEFRHAEGTRR